MSAPVLLARDLAAIADAVAALPRVGILPTTMIVVPSWALGHAIRRMLIETKRGAVLAGARFIPAGALAAEIASAAGAIFEAGEDALRAARVLTILRAGLPLRRFPLGLLRDAPGWETAFSRTITDLEAAGLRPEDLDRTAETLSASDADQLRDVAAIWRALDQSAGSSWSSAQLLLEAASSLQKTKQPGVPTLAIVTGHETQALASFLRALPQVRLALIAQQPISEAFLARVEHLYGPEARKLAGAAPQLIAGPRELDLLRTGLFADPSLLAEKRRPRSAGPDGSVSLEEQAGVEEEVQAAAEWASQQILAGVPLARIAVLVPRRDPWTALIVERLQRLPWGEGTVPLVVPGGVPVLGSAAGARLLSLVQALRGFLAIEDMPAVLVALRAANDAPSLNHGDAVNLSGSLGTVGGSRTRPEGSREWAARFAARLTQVRALLADDAATPTMEARQRKGLAGFVDQLAAMQPAIDALDRIAALVVANAKLRDLAPALTEFCDAQLLQPGKGAPVSALLSAALEPRARDPACGALGGDDALRLIEEAVTELRISSGRYGEPGVFVGTVAEAAGLPFRATRFIGLCEGALPSAPREDPVLPDNLRRALQAPSLRTARETVESQLQAFWRCIAGAGDSVVLSAPRLDPDGGQRQPSAVLLDALAALGRSNSEVADLKALRRIAFRPARTEAARKLASRPISLGAQLLHSARTKLVPASWHGRASIDLVRARRLLEQPELEGRLGAGFPLRVLPGVSPALAISPSSLNALLGCPHKFLLEKVLYWRDPSELPATGQLDPMTYGTLFHSTAELFFKKHGVDFSSRKRSIGHWKSKGAELAESTFDELCGEYPLAGGDLRTQQRDRLLREFESFLDSEWRDAREFVGAELPFGDPTPVRLPLKSGALHVHGRIDRLDIEDGRALVRDLKTGRAKARVGTLEAPTLGIDLQIAVYGMVVKQQAKELRVPKKVAGAYVYVDRAGDRERAFRDDFGALEKTASGWLDAGLQLLTAGEFPRTPNPDDCSYCSFNPICGESSVRASAAQMMNSEGPLGAYLKIKFPDEEELS
jgi:hypothetical protein